MASARYDPNGYDAGKATYDPNGYGGLDPAARDVPAWMAQDPAQGFASAPAMEAIGPDGMIGGSTAQQWKTEEPEVLVLGTAVAPVQVDLNATHWDRLPSNHDQGPNLILVPKGDPRALKLSGGQMQSLRGGRDTDMACAGNVNIGPKWAGCRNAWGHWDYIDLTASEGVKPLKIRKDGPYLVWEGPHGEMVFDVAMWRLEAENHLVLVKACGGNPGGPTRKSDGKRGRDFELNDNEGTISPATARHLVLGWRKPGSVAPWSNNNIHRIDGKDLAGDWCCVAPCGFGAYTVKAIDGDTIESWGWCYGTFPGGLCCGGEIRHRIPNTNKWRHFGDPNNITEYTGEKKGCNGVSCVCKDSKSHNRRNDPQYLHRVIPASEIAGKWCCYCWGLGSGCAHFEKIAVSNDQLNYKGCCFFNGIMCPFDVMRNRVYVDGHATNGWSKADDPGNIDWNRDANCVGNVCSCSKKC